jgi:hypothetical protein
MKIKLTLKIIVSENAQNDGEGFLKIKNDCYDESFSYKAFIENSLISSLFPKSTEPDFFGYIIGKRRYIKVEYNGKKIYRLVCSGNSKGIKQNQIALNYHSLSELGLSKEDNIKELDIALTSRFWYFFPFYWYNPNDAVRASYKLGIVAIIISILFSSK